MKGLIMDYPLTLTQFFERARKLFHRKTMATRVPGAGSSATPTPTTPTASAGWPARSRASASRRATGSATFAWNSHRHLEIYFAAPLMGTVLHTRQHPALGPGPDLHHQPRRGPGPDRGREPLAAARADPQGSQERQARHRDEGHADAPRSPRARSTTRRWWPTRKPVEALADARRDRRRRHVLHVGHDRAPQGRASTPTAAIYLHCFGSSTVDVLGICERDVILHIVPMFHANAWCVPFAGVMNGATQIFGGPNPQPRDIVEIVQNERVTRRRRPCRRCGSPSQAMLEKEPQWDISSIRCIPIGGSAAPKSLIELLRQEVRRLHAPRLGHDRDVAARHRLAASSSYTDSLPEEERYNIRAKQGAIVPGVEMRIVDEGGASPALGREERGRDPGARALGHQRLLQRPGRRRRSSPRTAGSAPATWRRIDSEGYVQIADRTKDLIKSRRRVDLERGPGERDHGPPEGAGGGGDRACRTRSGRSARSPASCPSRSSRTR